MSKCEVVGGESVPMSCREGVWAAHDGCVGTATCQVVGGVGATCVSAGEKVPLLCASGSNSICDDANHCTLDTCSTGGCVHVAQTSDARCDDGDDCTTMGRCQPGTGTCALGKGPACDDGNPCTKDVCKHQEGCVYEAIGGCELCTLPGPDAPADGAMAWWWHSIRFAADNEACDLNDDGKADNALGAVGSLLWVGGTDKGFAANGDQVIGKLGALWRRPPVAGSAKGQLQVLDAPKQTCSVDPAQACTVTASGESYAMTLGPGSCVPSRALDIDSAVDNPLLLVRTSDTALKGLPMPLGWACANPLPHQVWSAPIGVGHAVIAPTVAGSSDKGARLTICGAFDPNALFGALVAAISHCPKGQQFSSPQAQLVASSLLKPDVDTNGDGKPDMVSFAYVLQGRRVQFGGAK